ncbi:MAG TPA: YbhB/YbcL family Raf kinase inhibitor-like protein [Candidatus Acidoferrum sp.]|nr:YbhB/YbcL family Raf kinase inhibitor-like protein [Candidatus Acidoferrum sp.]
MRITSTAFRDGEHIPQQYSRYHQNKVPPLHIEDVPADARSLALIMDDPDAPSGLFTHWVVFDIDPKTGDIDEDHAPEAPARQGANSWGETQYGGPRPPSGEHRYFFHLYALDTKLDLAYGSIRAEVEQAMQGHVLDAAELMGRYAAAGEPVGVGAAG